MMVQAGEGVALLPINQQQYRNRDLTFSPLKARNAFIEFVMTWAPQHDTQLNRSFRELAKVHAADSNGPQQDSM
jgi:DNA-binding transcriptional LysR family regulator